MMKYTRKIMLLKRNKLLLNINVHGNIRMYIYSCNHKCIMPQIDVNFDVWINIDKTINKNKFS